MKRILFALIAFALRCAAQAPDCSIQFLFNSGNGTVTMDNRSCNAQYWQVDYDSDSTVTGFTLAFQYSTGVNTPAGSFLSYSGNTVNSSSSFGTAQTGGATYCNLATCLSSGGVTVNTPWVRISSTGGSGVGAIRGALQGWRAGFAEGMGTGGGGGGSGCPNPCPVTQDTIPWIVNQQANGTVLNGEQGVTASAVNLGTNTVKTFCLIADIANTIPVYVGNASVSTSNGVKLNAGGSWCPLVNNTNLVFVIASTTGASVSWGGTN